MIVHPVTEKMLEDLRSNPPQSLLLDGKPGVGLHDAAMIIVGSGSHTFVLPDEKTASRIIPVDRIRQIYDETKTKSSDRHFVVIDEAELMTPAAQTAFLKLLEEPTPSTHFILTSAHHERLLPTILSRVERHTVQPITHDQSVVLIASLGIEDATKRQQLLFIADGLSETLTELIHDEEKFESGVQRIKDARDLLQAPSYQRLLIANAYKADRDQAIALIDSATLIAQHSLRQNPKSGHVRQLDRLLDARGRLESNQNIRLCLARAVL